jgi:peptide/nickel transport system substrate-binding protein
MIRLPQLCALFTAVAALSAAPAPADAYVETPSLEADVAAGKLPPVAERLPADPIVVDMAAIGKTDGRSGGEIGWLIGRAKDVRITNVYSYARLVGYTTDFKLEPDILKAIDVEDGRIFTMHLRPGHKWSDGHPFTSEDFRYWWEDVAQNPDLSPYGADSRLLVDGELPTVEFPDETTIRYSWSKPNPAFLPALAGASPLYIFTPAHYMKQFHAGFTDKAKLEEAAKAAGERNWAALYIQRGDLYEAVNPNLPVLEPWYNTTRPPADRFLFVRNPFFHRVDSRGVQLPYIDRIVVTVAESSLIPAKAGAGESDLQARGLRFDNISFLKEGEERGGYVVLLWPTALGSEVALYPNMTANDDVWRTLMRDVRFRRALSLGIDREEINQVVYFGLARPSQNTALPESPFYDEANNAAWAAFDIDQANALLDEIGLTERDGRNRRKLPDGRPLEIVVMTTGERSAESDILQLIKESWAKIGVGLIVSSAQRDVFRQSIFAGDAVMSVWTGLDNGLITPATVPNELAPVDQNWLQYPKWGQYVQTEGKAGTAADMPWASHLMDLYHDWMTSADQAHRIDLVRQMLAIQAEQVTSIGTVQGVLQPIVVKTRLHNVPTEAIFCWDPGAQFGIYRPDSFWVDP